MMFLGLRQWLARKAIGRDPRVQMLIHGQGIAFFMTTQEIASLKFMTGDGSTYYLKRVSPEEEKLRLYCNVCTSRFEGDPDRTIRCPDCGSQDICLAEREVF